MKNYFTQKKEFEKIKKGDEVEVFIKRADEHVNGKVIENNINQACIQINDGSVDITIKYAQIESVEIFESRN